VVWRAAYSEGSGKHALHYEVDVESCECPAACITEASLKLIAKFMRARRVREATGGVFGGADSSEWAARWYDAVETIQGALMAQESARIQALNSKE
jgi:hypothetical protein